jgi:hypothetical protein
MRRARIGTLALGIVLGAAAPGVGLLLAQQGGPMGHGGHGAAAPATPHGGGHGAAAAADGPATAAFEAANARMHAAMGIAWTGDPDRDFALAMIPHHEGAIDLARIVLEHGRDPEVRKVAEAIVAAQAEEIAFFRAWLARRP